MRFALAVLALLPAVGHSDTVWVPDDHPTIQAAIEAAQEGDVIIVRPGTYVENIDLLGKAVTLRSQLGPEVTTIDGGAAGSVVTFDDLEGADSVLDGFTITNGTGTLIYPHRYGGGVFCMGSCAPTITNNTIAENSASYGGGISFSQYASPTLENNTISGNTVGRNGAGIYCLDSSPTIKGNTITSNQAGWFGGGFYCSWDSFPIITDNTFTNNTADWSGGAISSDYYCFPIIEGNVILGNAAGVERGDGGGIYCSSTDRCAKLPPAATLSALR